MHGHSFFELETLRDYHFLPLTLLVTVFFQYSVFVAAYLGQFDTLTDIVGSLNFIVCVALPLVFQARITWLRVTVVLLVSACRLWLGCFLLLRVRRRGKDARFDDIRNSAAKFFGFWTAQIIWIFTVSFGAAFVAGEPKVNPPFSAWHALGLALYACGFALQVVADLQKLRFRSDPKNAGLICTTGVWHYSRHPNYFGEMLIWWGIFFVCVPLLSSSEQQWGWFSVAGPILTMVLLLFVSGINLCEGPQAQCLATKDKAGDLVAAYQENTSPLLPCPPRLYQKVPRSIKTVRISTSSHLHASSMPSIGVAAVGANNKDLLLHATMWSEQGSPAERGSRDQRSPQAFASRMSLIADCLG